MGRVLSLICGIAIILISFFATLYLLESTGGQGQSDDSQRTEHGKALKEALKKYHAARGKYPSPYAGNDVEDLRNDLVNGGFISKIPADPYWRNTRVNKYRYRSSDGSSYSIMLHFELGDCQTGVGPQTKGTWDGHKVPECAF